MDNRAEVTVTFGKCPRCGKTDILVIVSGLKPFCRVCLKIAAEILEGGDF